MKSQRGAKIREKVRERTISTVPESRLPVSIIFKIFLNFTINALEQAT
jgi:hypothetical protein